MTEQQKIEYLMRPRYKQIGPYPGSKTDPGTIFYKHVFTETGNYVFTTNLNVPISGDNLRKDEVEGCPNLFQPMNWWEERTESEMPEYMKVVELVNGANRIGEVFKCVPGAFCKGENGFQYFRSEHITGFDNVRLCCFLPATKAEYESFMAKADKIK